MMMMMLARQLGEAPGYENSKNGNENRFVSVLEAVIRIGLTVNK